MYVDVDIAAPPSCASQDAVEPAVPPPPEERDFMMLIGSGFEGVGGTALVYRSKDLAKGGWLGL